MRVCFISTEYAGIGPYGGFGALTRQIAEGLAQRGLEIYVTMPRKAGQRPVDRVGNVTLLSYPSPSYRKSRSARPYSSVYTMIDADIYHSEEPSLGTCLAQIGSPYKRHVVTFQDPRTFEERGEGRSEPGFGDRSRISILRSKASFEIRYSYITRALRRADALYCQAWYSIPKTMSLYRLQATPDFLPNPVEIPEREMVKADRPTVCFLGRWDPRKRPEYFFELAKRFSHVKFICMGGCHSLYGERERLLRDQYQGIPNLTLTDWAQGEVKSKILEQSWILINTSWRECLPVSYLEACSHQCAILSHENPDDFAGHFGYWAKEGSLDDFAAGLNALLEGDRWKALGERGYDYVKNTHEYGKVIDRHIEVYTAVLDRHRK